MKKKNVNDPIQKEEYKPKSTQCQQLVNSSMTAAKVPYAEYLRERKRAAANKTQPIQHLSPARQRFESSGPPPGPPVQRIASPPRVAAESKLTELVATPNKLASTEWHAQIDMRYSPPSPPLFNMANTGAPSPQHIGAEAIYL